MVRCTLSMLSIECCPMNRASGDYFERVAAIESKDHIRYAYLS